MTRDASCDKKNRPDSSVTPADKKRDREMTLLDRWKAGESRDDIAAENHCCGFFSLGCGSETEAVAELRRSLSRRFGSDDDAS